MDTRTAQLLRQINGNQVSAFAMTASGDTAYWPQATNMVLTVGGTWTTPASQFLDARGAVSVFATVTILSITGGGSVTIALQSCPERSEDDKAWKTIASVSSVSTAGPQVLKCNRLSTEIVTGYLRLRLTGAGATVTVNLRGEVLLKQIEDYESGNWIDALSITLTGSGSWTMPLSWMLNASRYLSAYVLLSYSGTDGSNVTASLLTAPGLTTDTNLFKTVATTTLASSAQLLDGRSTATNPPMGVLRVKLAHAGGGTAEGVVRAQYLLKEV